MKVDLLDDWFDTLERCTSTGMEETIRMKPMPKKAQQIAEQSGIRLNQYSFSRKRRCQEILSKHRVDLTITHNSVAVMSRT